MMEPGQWKTQLRYPGGPILGSTRLSRGAEDPAEREPDRWIFHGAKTADDAGLSPAKLTPLDL